MTDNPSRTTNYCWAKTSDHNFLLWVIKEVKIYKQEKNLVLKFKVEVRNCKQKSLNQI